jgi:y4mF family transcriptional regulator
MAPARTPAELGALVRDERQRLGLTQAELARRAVVSQRWLSCLERGHPNAQLALVQGVLRALGLELAVTAKPVASTRLSDLVEGYVL